MTLSHCMNAECFQTYYTKINRDQRFKINKLEQQLNERNEQGRFLQMAQLDCASNQINPLKECCHLERSN